MYFNKLISEAIRAQRLRLKLTLPEVAELAGVSRMTVYSLEHGNAPNCSLTKVEQVCSAVGLELAVMIRGTANTQLIAQGTAKAHGAASMTIARRQRPSRKTQP